LAQGKRGVATAVIELNALPDAVRSAAEDDDFLPVDWLRFVLVLVARVQVGRERLKLGGAGVHTLEHRAHA